ncbi:RDD family protein [Glutamicibacter uratoxydans]|uniref:RDD family protein n=1 Tax=Glutamicibacter uratoxydans TaxID=43667 RepID=A0A4Y4DQ19_GLUUR|nr:RDD family protein [Glutamicibacter uratoxydans]GED07026.1 RDD family protein [Glutamicibacter uratoxydans]
MERKDFSSWLEGPPQLNSQQWPGEGLGRPERGPGSVARFPRRLLAVCLDWGLSMLVSYWLFNSHELATLLVFLAGQLLGVGLLGHSLGHRIFGMQVQSMEGKALKSLQGLIRSVLLCLFVPALVIDKDQRGLHDRLAKSILVNIR